MTALVAPAELVGLPGMPGTVQGVHAMAARQGWPREKRKGRGGGYLFPLDVLPREAQAAYLLKHNPAATASNDPAPLVLKVDHERFDRLPEKMKEVARRRLRAIEAVEHLVATGTGRMRAIAIVAENCDEHPNTIRNWFKLIEGLPPSDRLAALAPRYVGRQKTAECSPEAWEHFKADYLRLSRPAATACYDRLQRIAAERGWTVPSLDTLMRRLEREIPAAAIVLAREGRDAAERLFPAQKRDHSVFRALEAVNADGHKFDVFVRFADGEIARPVMLAWQDIYSGKILAWRLGRAENVELVRLSFGDLVEEFGIPDHVYLDNGRQFASKWMTGRMTHRFRFKVKEEEPSGILTQLGIKVHWTTPYHGQAKPIERAFRDLCETIARHPACEGAYTGNSPDAKPENYGSRAIPFDQFEALVAEEIARHNARLGRRSPVCAGRSFDQVFAESYAQAPIRKASEAQRRLFLLAAEGVTAAREGGVIRLFDNRYWTEALGAVAGRKVVVRFDPQHLDRPIHVYSLDGRYIATAPRIEATGFDDVEAARRHTQARKSWLKAQRALLDAERRLDATDVARALPTMQETPTPQPAVVRAMFAGPASALAPKAAPAVPQAEFEKGLSATISSLLQRRNAG